MFDTITMSIAQNTKADSNNVTQWLSLLNLIV